MLHRACVEVMKRRRRRRSPDKRIRKEVDCLLPSLCYAVLCCVCHDQWSEREIRWCCRIRRWSSRDTTKPEIQDDLHFDDQLCCLLFFVLVQIESQGTRRYGMPNTVRNEIRACEIAWNRGRGKAVTPSWRFGKTTVRDKR